MLAQALSSEDAYRLSLLQEGQFTPSSMAEHIGRHPGLAWHVPGTREYAVGGYWRHRSDIGYILESSSGRHWPLLYERVVATYERLGVRLVLLDHPERMRHLGQYKDRGFTVIDEIVQCERNNCRVALAPAPRLSVRPYVPTHQAAVLAVERESFSWLWWNSTDELDWYAAQPGTRIFVGCESWGAGAGGRVIGYVGATLNGDHGHIDRLAVRGKHQRAGHGTELLAFILGFMDGAGVKRVTLTTQSDNYPAQVLYAKFGFHRTLLRFPFYGKWLT